ncbi:TPA: TM2 domain-containing protein [Vibrio parahaemolyticus]
MPDSSMGLCSPSDSAGMDLCNNPINKDMFASYDWGIPDQNFNLHSSLAHEEKQEVANIRISISKGKKEMSKEKATDEKFCGDCGVRQTKVDTKSKMSAALLALFLGGLGAHKFYLGRKGWGIAYLLMFWTAIPAMIAFIEFIILLCTSEESFNEKYN